MRNDLQGAVETYQLTDGRPLPVRFVDVKTRDEFIAALNSFDGAFAIFDGHGSHNKGDKIGVLHLADGDLDVWDIRLHAKVPPIVFVCACDTHAMNRNHVTSANGLLFCGARAVIASVLPIHSKQAAIFAGRLLFRIYELLPRVTGDDSRRVVRWDGVVSVLQRMMFVSELIRAIYSRSTTGKDWTLEVEKQAVMIIHQHDADWYERVSEAISGASGLVVGEIERLRRELLPFPETLKYLHLGSPETIAIVPDNLRPQDYADGITSFVKDVAPQLVE